MKISLEHDTDLFCQTRGLWIDELLRGRFQWVSVRFHEFSQEDQVLIQLSRRDRDYLISNWAECKQTLAVRTVSAIRCAEAYAHFQRFPLNESSTSSTVASVVRILASVANGCETLADRKESEAAFAVCASALPEV